MDQLKTFNDTTCMYKSIYNSPLFLSLVFTSVFILVACSVPFLLFVSIASLASTPVTVSAVAAAPSAPMAPAAMARM